MASPISSHHDTAPVGEVRIHLAEAPDDILVMIERDWQGLVFDAINGRVAAGCATYGSARLEKRQTA